jgi:hypothetical protein
VLTLGAFAIISIFGNDKDSGAGGSGPTPSPGAAGATDWTLGRTFESGEYSLTIRTYADAMASLTEQGTWTAENGQFVILEISVTYNGRGEGAFLPAEQRLVTNTGASYTADVKTAQAYKVHTLGARPMSPGKAEVGYLAFDIPQTDKPAALEFVADLGSEPLTIPLG